ncbi:T9SS type A sorting domain-containing protein [Marinilabilia salmonicolor]|jgi:alpha-amylase|uniref:T9SS type A sorting domain-containing protein n=1 Tax=Marinilabilia salmonicolor TaxID=989 RepID=UPI000D06DD16|nr:T9SS type A sorting domain-containing protein [Marinilabilia salmonicolor]
MKKIFTMLSMAMLMLSGNLTMQAQNDVMLQAFYWDVPVDAETNNGFWWDNLYNKASEFKEIGITGIWIPSPAKGNWGIYDMGYGIFDHYDLGNYNQKGTVETRFGSRQELESMIAAMHDTNNGQPKVEVYADIILNHMYSSEEDAEANPAVKEYVFDEAFRNGQQYVPYPTNEIKWVIEDAAAGDYYIKFKGFYLDYSVSYQERAYDIQIDYNNSGFGSSYSWESEPNNGNGETNTFPASGETVRAFINSEGDIDEFKVTAPGGKDIIIQLTARRQSGDEWQWADQTHGFYPSEIWHNGQNLAVNELKAITNTGISYINHTGTGEANLTWDYSYFHPVDENDWLGNWGSGDEIITNTKGFGNDLNTFDPRVQTRMNNWGEWLSDEINFDGYRLDFVRGFQEEYVANWIANLPPINNQQRFIVGEYWGSASSIQSWVNNVATNGADADAFDFPLKSTLTGMCNGDAGFDMNWLNHAGMIRNGDGNSLPGTSVVTFLENHDTGKEHDKWVTKDWHLGYAYMLTHEGKPCIFYPHLYGVTLVDNHDASVQIEVPASLKEDLKKLIFIRKTYLNGSLSVLSESGNPYPSSDTHDVYVARREGNNSKGGAIVVLNNSHSDKGLWVDATPQDWSSWTNKTLVNAFNEEQTTEVFGDGRVWVEAPARGYAIYVLQEDYENYNDLKTITSDNSLINQTSDSDNKSELSVFPNPVKAGQSIQVTGTFEGAVQIQLFDKHGRMVFNQKEVQPAGNDLCITCPGINRGDYILSVKDSEKSESRFISVQ